MSTELVKIAEAKLIIDSYIDILKKQLQYAIDIYKLEHPDWEFDRLEIKYDVEKNVYNLIPIFRKCA